jgi:hypothetical protein
MPVETKHMANAIPPHMGKRDTIGKTNPVIGIPDEQLGSIFVLFGSPSQDDDIRIQDTANEVCRHDTTGHATKRPSGLGDDKVAGETFAV